MSLHVAFLRGINLGKRQMKMADLKACLEDMGWTEVKTILASGNVRFEAAEAGDLKERLERALEQRFGFPVGVVLRSRADLEAMLAADPFAGLDPQADVKRYILMFDRDLPAGINLEGVPGDFDVLRIDRRDIYFLAHRLPNGRYGEGLDRIGKSLDEQVGKGRIETMRNWNTIEKALK
ncbi:DUF1697 domain-containing protein [Devosia nitrariae]|uniref:DUF1697 domain-containing protein n=1 Tax=Devosia nitrariae TaxID=2071872 RepID=A0ABQ5W0N2_9HYPH|nr:DUF1697 domain-containing protein [Devosia nitrariae]GLQ53434.1 hypothetical protein GCM10010862_06920 [Devosia nitrariae]